MKREPGERILDMLQAIERIERYAGRGKDAFEKDELIQTWIVHHLQVIGEAAAKLPEEFRLAHSDIPWPQIVAMRNLLVHEYFGVDPDAVWNVVLRDLPGLKEQLARLA